MKLVYKLACLLLVFVFLAGCGGAPTETPQEKIYIPGNLSNDWILTVAGSTDWYVMGAEGVYEPNTGWTTFNFDGHQIFAIFQTAPNPTNQGDPFGLNFDVQWVEKGEVIKHATCFNVDSYNSEVEDGDIYLATKEYEFDHRDSTGQGNTWSEWSRAEQSVDYIYGCRFDNDSVDTVYVVHHHSVLSSAVQQLTAFAPTATPVSTATPTFTPGPGTPTAVIPTATLTNLGDIPFGCGGYARLMGFVNWNQVASLSVDCVKSIYTFVFRGDDVSQLPVDFWWDQATSQLLSRTKIPGCEVVGTRVICQQFLFNVEVVKPDSEIGAAQVTMPSGCGTIGFEGIVDWSKISSASISCTNSRFQLGFRGQNMDRVWFYIQATQNPNYIEAYTNLAGCVVNSRKATDQNSAFSGDTKKATIACEAQGISLVAVPR